MRRRGVLDDEMFLYEPPKPAFHDPPWMLTEVVREQTIDALKDLARFAEKHRVDSPWTRRCGHLHDELREQSRLRQSKVP